MQGNWKTKLHRKGEKDDFKENQKSNFIGSCAESDNAVMAAVGLCRNIAGN